jgi:predicted ribosome quality control (RQC) complex YloA/Tae2 family protein
VKKDQSNRLTELERNENLQNIQAAALEANIDLVEAALAAVNDLLARELPWDGVREIVAREAKNSNPVAQAIKQLKLQHNKITLSLPDPDTVWEQWGEDHSGEDSEENSEEDSEPTRKPKSNKSLLSVDVDLSLTAAANARSYYSAKKASVVKKEKTQIAMEQAIQSAEARAQKELKQVCKKIKFFFFFLPI